MHNFSGCDDFDLLFQTIVTGAGDETLRFWNVFPSPKSQVIIHSKIENNAPLIYLIDYWLRFEFHSCLVSW